jgi:steroid 5-alpha reductase family enzyme
MSPIFILLLWMVCLAVNTVGFRQLVYFVNIGYAASIVLMSLVSAIFLFPNLGLFSALHLLVLMVWGFRLGIYVLRRELQISYQLKLSELRQQYAKPQRLKELGIWLAVSTLYVLMFLPALFNLREPSILPVAPTMILQAAGLLVLLGGLLLESIADRQKSKFKARFPRRFCDTGLYRWVRCPNYLGEILIWLGSWLMGLPFYTTPWHWIGGLLGLICIILIMLGSTKRLEFSQDERYGKLPEYQAYSRSVPVLLPFLPIYSLKNIRFYLE